MTIESTLEKLNRRKGQKVIYRGSWGADDPEPAIFDGAEFDEFKDEIVIGVRCEDGHNHWGYIWQIEFGGQLE